MNYHTQHQNFVLFSPITLNQYLADSKFWQAFVACLTPFVAPVKGVPRITALQYYQQKKVKLGRLTWQADVLQKLADNYQQCDHPDAFYFGYLSAFFPNLTSCVKQNITPKLTLTLRQPYQKPYSGLLISLRDDYFDELGSDFVLDTLDDLSQLLNTSFRVRHARPYASPSDIMPTAWQNSIQDLFPDDVAKCINGKWQLQEDFSNWTAF